MSALRHVRLLRLLTLAALALPLTPVFDAGLFSPPQYAMLLDWSPSMEDRLPGFSEEALEEWRGADGVSGPVITFGSYPGSEGSVSLHGAARVTDLPAALKTAEGFFSGKGEKRLLLVTDGLTRENGLDDVLALLSSRGVKVFALSPPPAVSQAGVVQLTVPGKAFLWEPFTVKGLVASSSPGTIAVTLRRNGSAVTASEARVDGSGYGEVEFVQEADRVGHVFYDLSIPGNPYPPASGAVEVGKALKVRYVSDDPEASRKLVEVLRQGGVEVSVSSPRDLSLGSGEFEDYHIIVIDDVPAPALNSAAVDSIRAAVSQDGKGLLVIGGRKGLGSEDFRDSPLETLLPVTADYSSTPEPLPVSLVIAMDTSFSMFFRGRGQPSFAGSEPRKIDLAKESAKEVVRVTRPGDEIGIIGNSTQLYWVKPLGPVARPYETMEKIDGITAQGDGLNFYSIVKESYDALRESGNRTKHVLVFGDAGDIDQHEVTGEGHAFDLVREMSREGVTLSILAMGNSSDKDVSFLRTVALLGRGDFYLVSNLRALPRYFVSEYRKLSSRHFLEEEVRPSAGQFSRLLQGIEQDLPLLSGISLVTPREGTDTPLRTDVGVPLLTLGLYGAGQTAVFASDSGYRWASRLMEWPAAEKFWLQLLFSLAPREKEREGVYSSLAADPLLDRFVFRYRGGKDRFPGWERLWLTRVGRDDGPVELKRRGLTEYRSVSPLPDSGLYRYRVTEDPGGDEVLANGSTHVPLHPEALPVPENWPLLERVVRESGGEWISAAEMIRSDVVHYPVPRQVLVMIAVAAGLFLLLVEIAFSQDYWR